MPFPFALLAPRQVVCLRGPDRIRFLNGQMSNDCRKTHSGTQVPACILNAKGKLQFTIHVSVTEDSLLCDAPVRADGPTLFERLDRYLVADQVELSDDSANFALLHFPDHSKNDIPLPATSTTFPSSRLGTVGTDVWIPAYTASEWATRPERLSETQIAQRRILHGIPEWGYELDDDTLPAEAGLDRTHVDFHKGCYIGQEVVSRIKSVGRVNRSLARITCTHPLQQGFTLISAGRECGKVTTPISDASGLWHALALIHRTAEPSQIFCGDIPVTIEKLYGG